MQTGLDALGRFRDHVLPPASAASPMPFFPTPPDARWTDVEIQFCDGETVSILVKEARGRYSYSDMGMSHTRSKKPTKQWELLRAFAVNHGILDWDSRQAHRRNKKRRELLGRNLQAFFRIEGDPFRLNRDGKGWTALFAVLPE